MPDPKAHAQLVDALDKLLRAVRLFGPSHPRSGQAARVCCSALQGVAPPCELQIVGDGLFRGYRLVPLGAGRYAPLRALSEAFARRSVHELAIQATPTADELLELASFLTGGDEEAAVPRLPHLELRRLRLAEASAETHDDQERVALARLHRAALEVEVQGAAADWDVGQGLAVIRGLEQAVGADGRRVLAALELNTGSWTPARRALSCALLTVATLAELGVQANTLRAAGHAALCCALTGFREEGGLTLGQAADAALRRLSAAAERGNFGIPRHLLKVCALLRGLRHGQPVLAVSGLLEIAYGLERLRPSSPAAITRCELLAELERSGAAPEIWLRAVLLVLGGIPAGSLVEVDGQVGLALGNMGRESRLELLFQGGRRQREEPVRVLGSHELRTDPAA